MNSKITKFLLIYGAVIIMMLLCLFDMPYGYFVFVRYAAMVIFGYLAYDAHNRENNDRMIAMIALAVLIQPFIKLALGRTMWVIIDIIVAIYMGYLLFVTIRSSER